MKPYIPSSKIAIRDSIEEELSDDIDDDVFIRDGKLKSNEEKGLKRPLMRPRRNSSTSTAHAIRTKKTVAAILRQRNRCWRLCEPFCYALALLLILVALIFIVAFFLTMFPVALQKIKIIIRNSNFIEHTFGSRYGTGISMEYTDIDMFSNEMTPCTQLTVKKLWSKGFSKLSSESQLRKADLNGDAVDDIIFGYGVDDSVQYIDGIPKCEVERPGFREMLICHGGIISLDGITGNTIWQLWTSFIVFSIYCNADLNDDKTIDCVASGHGGHILAMNGINGEILWHFDSGAIALDIQNNPLGSLKIDLFSVNGIRDVDGDNIPDVLASSIEDRNNPNGGTFTCGHLSIWSGRNGKLIQTLDAPYQEEIYVPLQVLTQFDGSEMIIIATGGQSSPGGIYMLPLSTIMDASKNNNFIKIYRNPMVGFMVPLVLSDLNGDGIEDIVGALFNSTVLAFDGKSYEMLWNYTFAESESISAIVPGHYNHDNITDFMVKYNSGPGFPIYYYSQTQIIDGRNGSTLLDQSIIDSGGSNSLLAGLSLSQVYGGDFFLHWQVQCRDKFNSKQAYQFIPDSDIRLQTRADTCMLRYNTSTVLQLHAISRHVESPGPLLVTTDDLLLQLNQTELKKIEKQYATTSAAMKHPKFVKNIEKITQKINETNSNVVDVTTNNPINSIKENIQSAFERNSQNDQSALVKIKYHENVPQMRQEKMGNFEKPIFNEQTNQMDIQLSPQNIATKIENVNEREREKVIEQEMKEYLINTINKNRNRMMIEEQMDQKPQVMPSDEYVAYDEPDDERKIMYGVSNRDVRSKNEYIDETDVNDNVDKIADDVSNNLQETVVNPNRPSTLWDLEIEKEQNDKAKEITKQLKRRNRETSIDTSLLNQNLLAITTAPGALLSPIDKKLSSTIDSAFILNVRESELYPPLVLANDIICAKKILSNNKNYFTNKFDKLPFQILERNALKKCIEQRLPNLSLHQNKFEPQIVVTRLSITCKCDEMKKTDEKCSTLHKIDKQKWTEFMGNLNNGVF